MRMRGFVDWSVWFQRGTKISMMYQTKQEAVLVMASIMAHADNVGTGWEYRDRDDYIAFGHEVGLTADEFERGLAALIGLDLVRKTPEGQLSVNFCEKFGDEP